MFNDINVNFQFHYQDLTLLAQEVGFHLASRKVSRSRDSQGNKASRKFISFCGQ